MKRLSEPRVLASVNKHQGNISAVAREFGVARASIYGYIISRPPLIQAVKDARETMADNAESALGLSILGRDPWAVQFVLKTIGKDRGYTPPVERDPLEVLLAALPPVIAQQVRAELGNVLREGGVPEGGGDPPPEGPALP